MEPDNHNINNQLNNNEIMYIFIYYFIANWGTYIGDLEE